MENFKERWWRMGAGIIAIAVAFFGMGNLFEEDGGPLSGKIIAASVAVVLAGVLIAGLVIRTKNTARGSYMIAIGALPGTILTLVVWFPPVALVGLLSIFVAWNAFRDGLKHQSFEQMADPPR